MYEHLRSLVGRVERLGQSIGVDALRAQVAAIEGEMGQPGFWGDRPTAQARVKELERAKANLGAYNRLSGELDEIQVLFELADEEDDEKTRAEAAAALTRFEKDLERVRLQFLLSGPYDGSDCFLSLNAGAGGTDAQDWTEMLLRMYSRFCEQAGFTVRLVDEMPGEEAGLKSATLEVKGKNAFGFLKGESGIHRLVRISPFDSAARRHTSFASVTATPIVAEDDLVIADDDLRIDSFRAGGPGGQHMQKNETAIRITHLPTGIVVGCQNERSQLQNKLTAMRMLRAKLRVLMDQAHAKKIEELRGELADIEWGHQIRSYVLQPYQMVKDHRTEAEMGNVQAVLDGELWPFIWAWIEAGEAPRS